MKVREKSVVIIGGAGRKDPSVVGRVHASCEPCLFSHICMSMLLMRTSGTQLTQLASRLHLSIHIALDCCTPIP